MMQPPRRKIVVWSYFCPLVVLRIEHGDAATIIYHIPECEMFELD